MLNNGFYWVLLGFTGFYWVLLGFTEFYRVTQVVTSLARFYRVFKLVFTEFQWLLPGFGKVGRKVWGFLSLKGGFKGFHSVRGPGPAGAARSKFTPSGSARNSRRSQ